LLKPLADFVSAEHLSRNGLGQFNRLDKFTRFEHVFLHAGVEVV
jgi:hypothetical protein